MYKHTQREKDAQRQTLEEIYRVLIAEVEAPPTIDDGGAKRDVMAYLADRARQALDKAVNY